MRHCTLEMVTSGGKRVIGFVSITQHALDFTDQQELRKTTPRVLSRPGFYRSHKKIPTNLEMFFIGYYIDSTVPIGPVHVISHFSDWVTMSLITTVLGLGREDPRTSLLRPSKGVVASSTFLDELLLYSAVEF
jgi:hypothetical protein